MIIRQTQEKDLPAILALWNDGEVMAYVGFPKGLGYDIEKMQKWFKKLQSNPNSAHFSLFDDFGIFLGESFYAYDAINDLASLDIKLVLGARQKGYGYSGLSYAIDQCFIHSKASVCYVDPHLENTKAIAMYERLGFVAQKRPLHLPPHNTFYVMDKDTWLKRKTTRLSLREITKDNYRTICRLRVSLDQQAFVATSTFSLAQAKYEPEKTPLAIYVDEISIGLMMYGFNEEDQKYWIYRFIIDLDFQNQGWGRLAMEQMIAIIKEDKTHHCIRLSLNPNNRVAERLYASLGFKTTHQFLGDEIIYQLDY